MDNRWGHLNGVLERFISEGILTGCGMQVFKDNRLIYNHCVGSSTVSKETLLTDHTRLRIYSLSKTFTCACLMTLYEKGLFALDDPISRYIPEFSNPTICTSDTDISDVVPARRPITIRHLMTMTAGISYMSFVPEAGNLIEEHLLSHIRQFEADAIAGKPRTLHDLIAVIAKTPLKFEPGTHWLYGLDLSVIGYLVEVLSGKRLSEYMRETILEPLGLTNTCFNYEISDAEIANQTIPEAAWGLLELDVNQNEVKETPLGRVYGSKKAFTPGERLGFELPCGGMVSTLRDVGIYYAMLANGGSWNGVRILSPRTIDLMRTNNLDHVQMKDFAWEQNRGFGYGLGYRTMMSPSEAGFYLPEGSFGWDGASGCYALASPDHKLAVVFAEQSLPHHITYTIPRVMAALNADMCF